MPLKLVPPRKGKSPNFTIRGTYLGRYVDRTAGTPRRSLAIAKLAEIQGKIERGEYEAPKANAGSEFVNAALSYVKAGGERRYIGKLSEHFGETLLTDIDQAAVDTAAAAICPNTTGATRNRKVYTPTHAVLRHAGIEIKLRRPKGAKGRTVTDHLSPADADAIIAAAGQFDPELALLLRLLLYTGMRLGEALSLEWHNITDDLAWVRTSKNGDPRSVRLRADLSADLEVRRQTQGRVFRFHQGGWLKWLLLRAKLGACGLKAPARPKKGERRRVPPHRLSWVNFHTFRHTWATWMRRYSGTDLQGLVATGNWRDPRSAARYAHVVAREEWSRVEMLPAVGERKKA